MSDNLTCHACGGRIPERADDIVISHKRDREAEMLFYHDDGFGGECREAAYAEHERRGLNEWWLTQRFYTWTPEAAEGLEV